MSNVTENDRVTLAIQQLGEIFKLDNTTARGHTAADELRDIIVNPDDRWGKNELHGVYHTEWMINLLTKQRIGLNALLGANLAELAYGIVDVLAKTAKDRKHNVRRECAVYTIGILLKGVLNCEPCLEATLLLENGGLVIRELLDCLADKVEDVRKSAMKALISFSTCLCPEAKGVWFLPLILKILEESQGGKWQVMLGALKLVERMAKRANGPAKTGQDDDDSEKRMILESLMNEQMTRIIPLVEMCMHEFKSEVNVQAVNTMKALSKLLKNDDIAPRIELLIQSMQKPDAQNLQKAVLALSQTTFVAVVRASVLALVTPILERVLNTANTSQDVLRRAVAVIENLTKLVHEPDEARAFLPRLEPGVRGVEQRASLPEVRALAGRALSVMKQVLERKSETREKLCSVKEVREVISRNLEKVQGRTDAEMMADTTEADTKNGLNSWIQFEYIGGLIAGNINHDAVGRIKCYLGGYLKGVSRNELEAERLVAILDDWSVKRAQSIRSSNRSGDGDEDTDVEIVNATFSLGYGARILLSQANLRLLKGHRYGVCGRNGAGKSTLLRSIAEGKVEGFPGRDVVRVCFVEYNQGECRDVSVIDYVREGKECVQDVERMRCILEEVGFTREKQGEPVGRLSGGWKMKLALARAMIQGADILLLDEPTNHLDTQSVKWLEGYLKQHGEVTSLIVSHDSGFMDEVCTDIYYYEDTAKKLEHFKGNLGALVKHKPEAKVYYGLNETAKVRIKFPEPGMLTGVKSRTKAIIRLRGCSYQYEGTEGLSLKNVTCGISLSSRIGITGRNGAGKSTLMKIITGEIIPKEGKVERHANLRIGYIKQHSLEHVLMHLEKTPCQYLQWRYEKGEDRELLLSESRWINEAEEGKQKSKLINLGDGKAEKRIEGIMGRRKQGKSYAYEVKWEGYSVKENSWISRERLTEEGFFKMVQRFDDREAAREGLGYRNLEIGEMCKHFGDLGLEEDVSRYTRISGLSGGQKIKVVLAGAMWNKPHLLVMDEPTNFLDRDTITGLAYGLEEMKGGVVLISHNEEFIEKVCKTIWRMEDGMLHIEGQTTEDGDAPSQQGEKSGKAGSCSSSKAEAYEDDDDACIGKVRRKKGKKKMTRSQKKEQEVRRRLRYLDWLNTAKGTPRPPDTDDEEDENDENNDGEVGD